MKYAYGMYETWDGNVSSTRYRASKGYHNKSKKVSQKQVKTNQKNA
jgi:hypothetical protein